MSLLGRVDAIKAALGLPESIVGALPIVAAANLAMGIEPDACATLPAMVEKLEGVLGLQPLPATVPRAGAAPAQCAATTPARSSSSTAPGGRSAPMRAGSASSAPSRFLPPTSPGDPTSASRQQKVTEDEFNRGNR